MTCQEFWAGTDVNHDYVTRAQIAAMRVHYADCSACRSEFDAGYREWKASGGDGRYTVAEVVEILKDVYSDPECRP